MPSRQQVEAHYQLIDEMRAREEERAAQRQQQQATQQAALQYGSASALQQQAAGIQQQRDQTQFGYQAAHSQQQFGQQQQLNEQHVDLQARLNEVQLGQAEQMRLQKMHQARSAVEANPDLSPQERGQLITQIESGLNPLENRQRESQMIFQHLQSQALSQQTDQQGQLFNQRQQWLANGVQNNLQTLVDPNTGQRALYHVGPDGAIQQLDFSGANEERNMRIEHGHQQTLALQQQQAESAATLPGRMQHQELANQGMAQTMEFARQLQPGNVQGQQVAIQQAAQNLSHGALLFPNELAASGVRLDLLDQHLSELQQTQPYNVNLAASRAMISAQQAGQGPQTMTEARKMFEAARLRAQADLAHTRATTGHIGALTANVGHDRERRLTPGQESAITTNYTRAVQGELNHYQNAVAAWRARGAPGPNNPQPQAPAWLLHDPRGGNGPSSPQEAVAAEIARRIRQHHTLGGTTPAGEEDDEAAPTPGHNPQQAAAALGRLRAFINPQAEQAPHPGARPPGAAERMDQQGAPAAPPGRPWWQQMADPLFRMPGR